MTAYTTCSSAMDTPTFIFGAQYLGSTEKFGVSIGFSLCAKLRLEQNIIFTTILECFIFS
jgi:hypothetical protein